MDNILDENFEGITKFHVSVGKSYLTKVHPQPWIAFCHRLERIWNFGCVLYFLVGPVLLIMMRVEAWNFLFLIVIVPIVFTLIKNRLFKNLQQLYKYDLEFEHHRTVRYGVTKAIFFPYDDIQKMIKRPWGLELIIDTSLKTKIKEKDILKKVSNNRLIIPKTVNNFSQIESWIKHTIENNNSNFS